ICENRGGDRADDPTYAARARRRGDRMIRREFLALIGGTRSRCCCRSHTAGIFSAKGQPAQPTPSLNLLPSQRTGAKFVGGWFIAAMLDQGWKPDQDFVVVRSAGWAEGVKACSSHPVISTSMPGPLYFRTRPPRQRPTVDLCQVRTSSARQSAVSESATGRNDLLRLIAYCPG